tara:strand:- start:287 stop:610 length:324 start_codon:yes stop_codon:yes gene_type:complete
MKKVPEHQEGSTMYCTPAQVKRRAIESGYIKALLDICEYKVDQCEDAWNDIYYKSAIKDFWKSVYGGIYISNAKVLDILKLDLDMPEWQYVLFEKKYGSLKKYKEVA